MKAYRFLIFLLVVVIAMPFAGRLFWLIKRSKHIDIVIINKSVLKSSQNEMKSLNWTLNMDKFVDSSGNNYDYTKDYYGYFPDIVNEDKKIRSLKMEDVISVSENCDALVFLDNKGVEYNKIDKKGIKKKPYGGFNQIDYFLMKEMIGRQKLIIAEYNFFSAPTEDLVRYNAQQLIDIYSLGWSGKYFEDLSKDKIVESVSKNWLDIYRNAYSEEYNFKGPGILLINPGENRIIVLPAGKYMNSGFPTVETSADNSSRFNLPEKALFTGWFDISYQGRNSVISTFNLNLNDEGVSIMRKNGIASVFPAVIESGNKKFYYIAGDFSKGKVNLISSKLGFISSVIRTMNKGRTEKPEKFFHSYYDFLLSGILNQYYNEIKGTVN
jgi:hypothetical protein